MEQRLGKYIIEELLGEGSFAYVYRAKDEDLDRYVAMKILKPIWMSDQVAIGRFKQEARTMAKLDKNPHIAVVYEVGEAEGKVYLTQLLVDGETLTDKIASEGTIAWPETVSIIQAIASALDYAHGQGVIHRDIKPSNILLDEEGKPYLGDFGLVRAAEGSESVAASVVGVKGTASYIPPEVWDEEEATAVSDVYALTCVVSEMLTGQVLFEGSSMMQVMRRHDRGAEFPDTWPEGIPAGVTEVLRRGLATDPKERIQSAGELASALAALSDSPQLEDTAEPISTPVAAAEVFEPVPVAKAHAFPETVEKIQPKVTPAPAAEPAVALASKPRPEKSKSRMPMIIGVVVVVLIIAGIAGFFVLSSTPTGGGTPVAQSGQSSAASGADEEPTNAPSPTPLLNTPEASTESMELEFLYEHRFDAESAEWSLGQDEFSSGQLSNGSYLVTVTGENWRISSARGLEFDDFGLIIDATPVEHSGEYGYGIIFRVTPEGDFYLAEIQDHTFLVWLFNNGEWALLVEPAEMPPINADGFNALSVSANGPNLDFFINNEYIYTIQDNTLQSGSIGIYVNSVEESGSASVAFDNVLVFRPK